MHLYIFFFKMVVALCKFGINLDEYLHMIMPPLVNLFDATVHPTQVSQVAMETVAQLAYTLDFGDFASRIIHGIVCIFYLCHNSVVHK